MDSKKNNMKPLLIFLFLLTSFALCAQTDVNIKVDSTGPNNSLGLPETHINAMCTAARKQAPKYFKKVGFLTSFEERILYLEGVREADVLKLMESDPSPIFEIIRKAWNEKWSKVYCDVNSSGIDGYIDSMLLFSLQRDAFRNLYDNNGNIKANVNRLVNLDPYSPVNDAPATMTDIFEKMLAEKWGQLAYSETLEKELRLIYHDLINYGGKKASQLSKEEFELELSRARKEAKE